MMMMMMCALLLGRYAVNAQPQCRTFENIYGNGESLCNTIFGSAFVYDTNEDDAYTMWFFDNTNPNDAVTQRLNASSTFADPNACHLDYYHKDVPSPEAGDNFTECHPWKSSSCCYQQTVSSVQAINEAYGAGYHWDRCGPLSQACERFFVQEACFYECDANAGFFRKYHPDVGYNASAGHNAWQIEGMPIKASYCDAWFEACRNDLFCGDGDYFACANIWEEHDASPTASDSSVDTGLVVGVVVAALVATAAVALLAFLVLRERAGSPIFNPLVQQEDTGRTTHTSNL